MLVLATSLRSLPDHEALGIEKMKISQKFKEIIGLPISDFKLIAGGSLILYIGEKQSDTKLTSWCLHIDSAWRLDHAEKPVLGSLDACVETKDEAEPSLAILRKIQGNTIKFVMLGKYVKDIIICFSGDYKITTFSHSLCGDSWELRCRDGRRVGMENKDITQINVWNENQGKRKT